jgi:hypothetical protein|tara:strand:- start:343 stop:642 length:300 start_codon:yes stop_codon:yes gene_type:complete
MTMESHVTNTFCGDRQPLETLKVAVMVPRSVDHETKQVRSRDVKKKTTRYARAAGSVGGTPRRKLGATIRCREKSPSFRTRAAWVEIASVEGELLIDWC